MPRVSPLRFGTTRYSGAGPSPIEGDIPRRSASFTTCLNGLLSNRANSFKESAMSSSSVSVVLINASCHKSIMMSTRHRCPAGPFHFPPSFSPGRESRALTMRRHGHGNRYSAGGRRHRTRHLSLSTTFITHNKGSGFQLRRESRGGAPGFSLRLE